MIFLPILLIPLLGWVNQPTLWIAYGAMYVQWYRFCKRETRE